ncbi:amidohydrolase [Sporosarcina sp. NCCP-2222]|uniref:amidohydrolase family protein n=1 Tax=Sporosarcina sp. NCCP-2222 TaxID=2935073 RepID=UPI00207E1B31|nr:amidohydrolase [Sporosarcina sp. NCCP-2222]GKV56629.1 amidohydrolase [Sporosarcina sp. NCCP-2222]
MKIKEHADLLVYNCSLLTPDFQITHNQTVVIKDSTIVEIGDTTTLSDCYTATETIDAKGKLAMPGLIDAHTHTCQQLLRGRIADELPMIWTRIMVPFESHLQEKDVRISSQLSCLEMIKSGTTAFIDAGGRHMHQAAESILESGLRGVITCSTMDSGREIPSSMKLTIAENIELNRQLFNAFNGAGNGRLDVWFSLRSIISCTPELTQQVFAAAKECSTGVQSHMNEYTNEIGYCLENFKMRPYEYLESLGVLDKHFLGAHSILLSPNEMDIIQQHDCKVTHSPASNSGKGLPNTPQLLQRGITVSLGTDGAGHSGLNLFDQMRIFKSLMRATYGAPISDPVVMPSTTLLEMATVGGAKAMRHEDQVGTLEAGKKADLILIDINQPHIQPTHNLVNTLIEVVTSRDVTHTIVDGQLLMKDRQVLTMDEEKILFESSHAMKELSVRANI